MCAYERPALSKAYLAGECEWSRKHLWSRCTYLAKVLFLCAKGLGKKEGTRFVAMLSSISLYKPTMCQTVTDPNITLQTRARMQRLLDSLASTPPLAEEERDRHLSGTKRRASHTSSTLRCMRCEGVAATRSSSQPPKLKSQEPCVLLHLIVFLHHECLHSLCAHGLWCNITSNCEKSRKTTHTHTHTHTQPLPACAGAKCGCQG